MVISIHLNFPHPIVPMTNEGHHTQKNILNPIRPVPQDLGWNRVILLRTMAMSLDSIQAYSRHHLVSDRRRRTVMTYPDAASAHWTPSLTTPSSTRIGVSNHQVMPALHPTLILRSAARQASTSSCKD